MRAGLLGLVCLPCLFAPAAAQGLDNVYLDAPSLVMKKPKAGPPDVKPPPQLWPRLDPGTVLCQSEADLDRLAARRRGEDAGAPIACQVIRAPTGVEIIQRHAGRTQVRLSGRQTAGWTDIWLPEKAPGGAKAAH